MRNLLVTGLTGFVGQVISDRLVRAPYAGRFLPSGPPSGFDIVSPEAVRDWVRGAAPDWVIHLAAQSHVPTAIENPAATLQVNLMGTLNLLQALTSSGFTGRLLYVSSADVYGQVDESALPLEETTPPAPRNPYAVSKAAAELLCRQWRVTHGLDVVIARPFNHVGPGQRPTFALSGFAREIAAIALGRQAPVIAVGDLDVTRDFMDVKDVIDAYFSLLDRGESGQTYNICSGQEYRLRDLLASMLAHAGVEAEIVPNPGRYRPAEQRRMRGSHARITHDTGWQPMRPLPDTLGQMIEYWKMELQH